MSQTMTAPADPDFDNIALPPCDIPAEQAVLGALLLSSLELGEVTAAMDVADFYRPAHAAIYEAIIALHSKGDPTEPVAVSIELERRGELVRVGGAPYLHTLTATVPTAANAAYYAEKVAEMAVVRRLVEAGTTVSQLGYNGAQGADIDDILERARAAIENVVDQRTVKAEHTIAADMRATWFSKIDDLQAGRIEPGLPTGFADLDAVIGGLKGGQFIVVAGRPGLGKSTLARDIIRNTTIKHGKTCALYSLEMSTDEVMTCIISSEAKVRLKDLNTPGSLEASHYQRIAEAWERIENGGTLIINENPTMTAPKIWQDARRIKAKHGLGLIVVDYLQLMSSGGRNENRQVEVSEFSRTLKIVAKSLNVPVIALSQLNRGPEQRQDKRPLLSDLRESGSLEQDADMVILLNRPEVYDANSDRCGEADLILAKHRGGPTTTVTVAQQLHYSRFGDLARS